MVPVGREKMKQLIRKVFKNRASVRYTVRIVCFCSPYSIRQDCFGTMGCEGKVRVSALSTYRVTDEKVLVQEIAARLEVVAIAQKLGRSGRLAHSAVEVLK